jgi:hypothetical protein
LRQLTLTTVGENDHGNGHLHKFSTVNPSFVSILDQTPAFGTHDASMFEVINNDSFATNGFVFGPTGTGFTYSGTTPTPGPSPASRFSTTRRT